VSRCQGVMFYLKENNLRYWSVGVCLLFFTFSARMHSSDQTHVNIIFLFLYISLFIWRMFKWCIVMRYWFLLNRCIYFIFSLSLSLSFNILLVKWILSSFILVSHKCHSIISFSLFLKEEKKPRRLISSSCHRSNERVAAFD
jgi:hypothetical protein